VSFFSHVGVDIVGLSVGDLGRIGPTCGGKNIRCKRSVGGAQVTCVRAMGVYKIGTYMYNGVLCICMLSQS